METPEAYIPIDRQLALARKQDLPDRTTGAALFADISGFTPLTEALVRSLGERRGAEELPRQLNLIYDALIAQVHHYGGTVINFSGDAITCWFDGDHALRAFDAQAVDYLMKPVDEDRLAATMDRVRQIAEEILHG